MLSWMLRGALGNRSQVLLIESLQGREDPSALDLRLSPFYYSLEIQKQYIRMIESRTAS